MFSKATGNAEEASFPGGVGGPCVCLFLCSPLPATNISVPSTWAVSPLPLPEWHPQLKLKRRVYLTGSESPNKARSQL